jgi:hypothetical protein
MKKSISLHPKFVAVVDGIINLGMLWWLSQMASTSWWMVGVWILVLLLIWGLLMYLMYYPPEFSKLRHLLSLVIFSIGMSSYLLFVEWQPTWLLIGACFLIFNFFSFWLIPASNIPISPFMKPNMRWRFIMSVLGLSGIFVGIRAVVVFQLFDSSVNPILGNDWFWLIVGAIVSTFIAGWWWNEYSFKFDTKFWRNIFLWFILMAELLWVIQLLPMGYLVSGLILIWCWYILWLLVRFSMSPEGIDWKRQMWFLGINAVLFISFLTFAVKWR